MDTVTPKGQKLVAWWLLVGVAMIIVQVLLGGITRLTGSGLSITEWKPIMGALPPLNAQGWETAFDKYKQIAQYKYINSGFTLDDFKFIFFWEWLHRLWARLLGLVFIIPFCYFISKKYLHRKMVKPMIILFLLGGLQGLVGWIMVQSGLNDSELVYVSHYKLAIHFVFALALLCYTFWFALSLLIPDSLLIENIKLKRATLLIIVLSTVQLFYGAFMAGLKAATAATTWPSINGRFLPQPVRSFGNKTYSSLNWLFSNPLVVQFIHRMLAYIIAVAVVYWWWVAAKDKRSLLLNISKSFPIIFILAQIVLGVAALFTAVEPGTFLWVAIAHQFVGMCFLLVMFWMLYVLKPSR